MTRSKSEADASVASDNWSRIVDGVTSTDQTGGAAGGVVSTVVAIASSKGVISRIGISDKVTGKEY